MNKKYIKRQITLGKLGLSMDSQVKEYYDYFHRLIGNINELEELTHDYYPNKIFWRKNGKLMLGYDITHEEFWVNENIIWEKLKEKNNVFNYKDISELLSGMLGEVFKLNVTRTLTSRKLIVNYWERFSN